MYEHSGYSRSSICYTSKARLWPPSHAKQAGTCWCHQNALPSALPQVLCTISLALQPPVYRVVPGLLGEWETTPLSGMLLQAPPEFCPSLVHKQRTVLLLARINSKVALYMGRLALPSFLERCGYLPSRPAEIPRKVCFGTAPARPLISQCFADFGSCARRQRKNPRKGKFPPCSGHQKESLSYHHINSTPLPRHIRSNRELLVWLNVSREMHKAI